MRHFIHYGAVAFASLFAIVPLAASAQTFSQMQMQTDGSSSSQGFGQSYGQWVGTRWSGPFAQASGPQYRQVQDMQDGTGTAGFPSSTDASSARAIVCSVFGILANYGLIQLPSSCSGGGQVPPPAMTGTLIIVKVVQGGSSTPAMFTMNIGGGHATPSSVAGTAGGTAVTIEANSPYDVTEAASSTSGYYPTYSSSCSGVMPMGAVRTCIVTNSYTGTSTATTTPSSTGMLTIKKLVDMGTSTATSSAATSSDFMIHLWNASSTDVSGSPQAGTMNGTTYSNLMPGTYRVSETGNATSSYSQLWSGDCDANGFVTISASSSKSCTLTNKWNATSTATST